MKKKPYFKGILEAMENSIQSIFDGTANDLRILRVLGSILEEYDLPEEKDDVYFIVEELEKKIGRCTQVERLVNAQNYLVELMEKIRTRFLKSLLIDFFNDKKSVRIVMNKTAEAIIIGGSLKIMNDRIAGRTPDKKNVEFCFSDIRLQGGILPLVKD